MPENKDQLERGVTSEIPPLLAIAHANRGGIPPNRAHTVLPLWPNILTIPRGYPDTNFPWFYVAALQGIPNTAYLCIG